jgi:inner membrane protein involved in colicin E2 resistance
MKKLNWLKKNVVEISTVFIFLSLTLALFDVINLAAYALLIGMGLIFFSIVTYETR